VAEDVVTLYGKAYRAAVVHSSSHDQRREKRLDRELQEAYTTLEATVRTMAQQTYFCRADAEAAAQQLRALPSMYHHKEDRGLPLEWCVYAQLRFGLRKHSKKHCRSRKKGMECGWDAGTRLE
jgi:hypothetical protein